MHASVRTHKFAATMKQARVHLHVHVFTAHSLEHTHTLALQLEDDKGNRLGGVEMLLMYMLLDANDFFATLVLPGARMWNMAESAISSNSQHRRRNQVLSRGRGSHGSP